MLALPRLIAAAAVALFLLACFYVGFINEQLKGVISSWHRGTVMIGFIIGTGAVSRYLMSLAERYFPTRKRARR